MVNFGAFSYHYVFSLYLFCTIHTYIRFLLVYVFQCVCILHCRLQVSRQADRQLDKHIQHGSKLSIQHFCANYRIEMFECGTLLCFMVLSF